MKHQHVKYHSVHYWQRRLNGDSALNRQDYALLYANFERMLDDSTNKALSRNINLTIREYDQAAVNAAYVSLNVWLNFSFPGWYTSFQRISLNERYRRFKQLVGFSNPLGA